MQPTNYYIQTSQGNISIWDTQGPGKPVFFIHGNSACKECFSEQFSTDLPGKYRFIAMDLPGHGNSDKAQDPENAYTISGYSDVAIEVIKNLNLHRPVIVGWSLGGHIGLNLIQKSQKLAGLLITGTPPINVSKEGFEEGFLPLPLFLTLFSKIEFSREEAAEFMTAGGIDAQQYPFIVDAALNTHGIARNILAKSMGNGVGGNQKEIVEIDDTPLCVVQGENDLGINNKYILEKVAYKNLFNNQVFVIKNSGHAVFLEKKEEFNKILAQFLSKVAE